MSLLPAINREAWRLKAANGHQYHHVEKRWQEDRDFPDRSGPLQGKGSVHGIGGFSENPCPLARLRLGPPPPKTPPPPPDLPVGAPEVIKHYKQEFNKRDYQGAGEVSVRELQELMKAVGRDLSEAAIKILVQQIDSDGSGSVNFTEFLEGCFGIREPRPTDKPPLRPMEQVFKDMREAIDRDDIKGMERLIDLCRKENMPPVLRAYKEPTSSLGIIHVAARSGSDRMVLLMIEHHADPNEQCRGQETPLHFATQSTGKYRERMVAALLAAGAKRMARTTSGYTPIHYLSSECHTSGFDHHDDPAIMDRFRLHRRKHHHAHGYHPMMAIADIVGADRRRHHHHHHDPTESGTTRRKHKHHHSEHGHGDANDHHRHRRHHHQEDRAERRTGKSHRSSRSRHSAKTNDEVRLVDFDEEQVFDKDGNMRGETRGQSASTKASEKQDLNWLTKERVRFEKRAHDTTPFSDSD